MFAVIFKAEINQLDAKYTEIASRMRQLAINKYGCKEISTATQDNVEITISYWENKEQITSWKQDPEHQQAQQLGQSKWYKSYQVQIVEIKKEYKSSC